jgi:acetylornithine/succinyldiaminopimelate/putrescine aminotransferase
MRHKLILTCGSDFHGKTKPSIAIGSTDCENKETDIISGIIKDI